MHTGGWKFPDMIIRYMEHIDVQKSKMTRLSDTQLARLKPHLSTDTRGKPRVDVHRVIVTTERTTTPAEQFLAKGVTACPRLKKGRHTLIVALSAIVLIGAAKLYRQVPIQRLARKYCPPVRYNPHTASTARLRVRLVCAPICVPARSTGTASSNAINDVIDSPVRYYYAQIGREVGLTTLGYIKVTSDIMHHFGDLDKATVAEIGVGYGGQCLIFDQVYKICVYTMFDLPPVLNLVSKYLESSILNSSYELQTLNQCNGSKEYDLVISNDAFSELPALLQRKYIEKVFCKAKHGYLTMNSGREGPHDENKLAIDELRALLPPFNLQDEEPHASDYNHLIV